MIDENKFKRLPKWAQDEIKVLQRKIIDQENKINQLFGKEPSNITASVGFTERNLPDDSAIKFKIKHSYIKAYLVDNEIRIYSSGRQIKIIPQAGNSIHIAIDE